MTVLTELSEKYRDRAKERREGGTQDQNFDPRTSTSGYRAVAPEVVGGIDAAERRKKMIQESKFLGGDLLHTHLVKGLDFALLQKVRSEITHHEKIQEIEMEKIVEEQILENEKMEASEKQESDDMEIKTVMGRNILRLITIQKSKTVERNEMFMPGRMAYLVELEDETAESDIPTTIIRSKSDTAMHQADLNTLSSTHDIVVNKLTQIFSYLRQGGKKKNRKRDKEIFKIPDVPDLKSTTTTTSSKAASSSNSSSSSSSSSKSKHSHKEDSIYGDIGEYRAPSHKERKRYDDKDEYRKLSSSSSSSSHKKSSSSSTSSNSKRSYFDKPNEEEEMVAPAPPKLPSQLFSKLNAPEIDGYAECYPGLEEMDDAVCDSDDDVDYTKMDKGNKKGPVGRWDFETQEEYSDYMSTREALPKAAFQVKFYF